MAEPLQRALESVKGEREPFVVYPSPQGTMLHQELVEDLSRKEHLVILCGHYEGIDEDSLKKTWTLKYQWVILCSPAGRCPRWRSWMPFRADPEWSASRKLSKRTRSLAACLTRPTTQTFRMGGSKSAGDTAQRRRKGHKEVAQETGCWRTLRRRPDIVGRAGINALDVKRGICHGSPLPCLDKRGERSSTAITGMDLHDIARGAHLWHKKVSSGHPARTAEGYGQEDRGPLDRRWGSTYNPDRSEAFPRLRFSHL